MAVHLGVLQMVPDYSQDGITKQRTRSASEEIPYFDWIFQDESAEPEWTGSTNEWMNEKNAGVRMEWNECMGVL